MSFEQPIILLQIIFIDIVMAADNAIIIGLVASWITVFPAAIALGLIADLINRLVELIVVIPFGLTGQHFIRKKLSRG